MTWRAAITSRHLVPCFSGNLRLASGGAGSDLHNRWPELWARLNQELVRESRLSGVGSSGVEVGRGASSP